MHSLITNKSRYPEITKDKFSFDEKIEDCDNKIFAQWTDTDCHML